MQLRRLTGQDEPLIKEFVLSLGDPALRTKAIASARQLNSRDVIGFFEDNSFDGWMSYDKLLIYDWISPNPNYMVIAELIVQSLGAGLALDDVIVRINDVIKDYDFQDAGEPREQSPDISNNAEQFQGIDTESGITEEEFLYLLNFADADFFSELNGNITCPPEYNAFIALGYIEEPADYYDFTDETAYINTGTTQQTLPAKNPVENSTGSKTESFSKQEKEQDGAGEHSGDSILAEEDKKDMQPILSSPVRPINRKNKEEEKEKPAPKKDEQPSESDSSPIKTRPVNHVPIRPIKKDGKRKKAEHLENKNGNLPIVVDEKSNPEEMLQRAADAPDLDKAQAMPIAPVAPGNVSNVEMLDAAMEEIDALASVFEAEDQVDDAFNSLFVTAQSFSSTASPYVPDSDEHKTRASAGNVVSQNIPSVEDDYSFSPDDMERLKPEQPPVPEEFLTPQEYTTEIVVDDRLHRVSRAADKHAPAHYDVEPDTAKMQPVKQAQPVSPAAKQCETHRKPSVPSAPAKQEKNEPDDKQLSSPVNKKQPVKQTANKPRQSASTAAKTTSAAPNTATKKQIESAPAAEKQSAPKNSSQSVSTPQPAKKANAQAAAQKHQTGKKSNIIEQAKDLKGKSQPAPANASTNKAAPKQQKDSDVKKPTRGLETPNAADENKKQQTGALSNGSASKQQSQSRKTSTQKSQAASGVSGKASQTKQSNVKKPAAAKSTQTTQTKPKSSKQPVAAENIAPKPAKQATTYSDYKFVPLESDIPEAPEFSIYKGSKNQTANNVPIVHQPQIPVPANVFEEYHTTQYGVAQARQNNEPEIDPLTEFQMQILGDTDSGLFGGLFKKKRK